MSDTMEALRRRVRHAQDTVDLVCDRVAVEVDASEVDAAVGFARVFLGRAPDDLLRRRPVDDLVGMTLGAWRFLRSSRSDRVDVAVLDPTSFDEGWEPAGTVFRTNVSERPFIIDTIRELLLAQELAVEWMVYPILDVTRDAEQRVIAVGPASDAGTKESLVHCEVEPFSDPDRLEWLRVELTRRLQAVVRATDDFEPMLERMDLVLREIEEYAERDPERRDEVEEIRDFLAWLRNGGLVFLGYRGYDFVPGADGERVVVVDPGSGLGILRNEAESRFAGGVPLSGLDRGMRRLAETGPLLIISKTNAESPVHRRARMDYIGIKKLDDEGRTVGEHRFVGLFTSRTYSEPAENIPILRKKLARILEDARVRPGSHDYKEIITIFNSMPKEELFLTSAEEIGQDVRTILTAYNTEEVRVAVREDPLQRGLAVMVILPKERFSGEIRKAIEAALVRTFDGDVLNYHLALGSGDQARLHFYIGGPAGGTREVRIAELERALEQKVRELIRTWEDRVREGLEEHWSSGDARRLAERYGRAMSREYQVATDPATTVSDIGSLEGMRSDGRTMAITMSNPRPEASVTGVEGSTELKVFLSGERLVLSDFMPLLEDAGLRVLAVKPFEVGADRGPEPAVPRQATIYVFAVQDAEGRPLDVETRGTLLADTILAVREGEVLSDRLNALVLTAGLHWREVDLLRAYAAYAFQMRGVASRQAIPNALGRHPEIARMLFDMFEVRFDPRRPMTTEERTEALADVRRLLHAALRSVTVLAEDRALRSLERLISATLRTNYYRRGGRTPDFRSGGAPYLSFKFACADIDFGRRSGLLYEVWVHSARMEGVHLRGAPVARGGVRWSDRPDDFRTEVLGLVRTQVVKNAVIVPAGSKGGFVTRLTFEEPEARLEEGRAQYRTLVRGLLDLTDNLEEGRVVRPEKVVAYDEPDPYLVVAADKGTASFSDLANGVSAEYRFWLDDAFASGGSHGYDHKAVGITARGAWECVKRHFREKGKDIQQEPFTVVGIGDMSGDVFGNGMLRSERTRLVAAFDHRHVFIDPDPDPAGAYGERRRLFGLGRSSWDDYDRSKLSPGGMIVARGAKEVALTPEARSALGLGVDEPDVVDGETLVRHVLRAPVELLWNGGIGTYVKASSETHGEAGDPSNDAVRVDASELRCAVVGEGGNLGFTQKARIEFALGGGRINTDALDNSGGVDLSDHEVNLKILLAPAVASGAMGLEERNALLDALGEEVAELVLDDNRSQSLAVSLDEQRVRDGDDDFRDLMFQLEKSGRLDRVAEALPSLDVLRERSERGHSLVRPELCTLLAYAKLDLQARLLESDLPDDPATEAYLRGYFPAAAVAAAGEENLLGHRLRREIIASQLTNDLVDLMGAAFVTRVVRDTGARAEHVVKAWLVASRLADHRALARRIARQDTMNARSAHRWLLGLGRLLERTTGWVLQNVDAQASPAKIVEESVEGLTTLRERFGEVVAGDERTLYEARVREIREVGVEESFGRRLITLRFLDQLLEILRIARATDSDPLATARAYYRISELFEVPWIRRTTFAVIGDDPWEHRAAQALADDLSRAHRKLVTGVMDRCAEPERVLEEVDALTSAVGRDMERYRTIVDDLKGEGTVSFAALSVAARQMSGLADRTG